MSRPTHRHEGKKWGRDKGNFETHEANKFLPDVVPAGLSFPYDKHAAEPGRCRSTRKEESRKAIA